MKVRYKPTPTLEFEVEGATPKEVFGILAQTNEVFGEGICGHCESDDIYPKMRKSTAKQGSKKGQTFTYFEYVCRKCGYFLPIGQHHNDQGTLFPDRKVLDDKGEKVYDNRCKGWRKPAYRQDQDEDES